MWLPAVVADATKEYRSEMDVIAAFLDDCCTIGAGREKPRDLYQAYCIWAKENNEYLMSNRKFGNEMTKRFETYRSNGIKYFAGLILNSECRSYQVSIG